MSCTRPSRDMLLPRLRRVRENRALTQEELADMAGVTRQTVLELESQRRSARAPTIRKLAKALHVKPEALTGRTLD